VYRLSLRTCAAHPYLYIGKVRLFAQDIGIVKKRM
jgi:hypothetical protein